jgi:hypothetical protein
MDRVGVDMMAPPKRRPGKASGTLTIKP